MAVESPRVMVAGGGVAGIEAALALRQLAPAVEVELVTPETGFEYRQLSVVEPFGGLATRYVSYDPLRALGVTVTQGGLAQVDVRGRQVALVGGGRRHYDGLLVAVGAKRQGAYALAATFTGPAQAELLRGVVDRVDRGEVRSVVFVVPPGFTWPLPLYELALQLARHPGADVRLVTPEPAPLDVFGHAISDYVRGLLEHAGVTLHAGVEASVPQQGEVVADGATWPADRVITLPVLAGPQIRGLPADPEGFIPVDDAGRVDGAPAVYAAGDATTRPIKQGGLAAQDADRAVAALLGDLGLDAAVTPERPTLRAILITGSDTCYLRRELGGGGQVSSRPLWWPPSKVVGHHLSPFLDGLAAAETPISLERSLAAAQLEGDQ